jgi:hypothetical protein
VQFRLYPIQDGGACGARRRCIAGHQAARKQLDPLHRIALRAPVFSGF